MDSSTTNGSFAAIIGDHGALHIAGPFATTAGTRDFLYLPGGGQTPERIEVVAERTGHALEIEDFSQAILEHREPYLSMDDSIGNLAILQDVVENGQPL